MIRKGSIWKYRGPGDGKGLLHRVLMVDSSEVITWSQSVRHPAIAGFSWLGPRSQFVNHFIRVS